MRTGLIAAAAIAGIVTSTWGPRQGHADDEPGERGSETTLGAALGVMFLPDALDQRVHHLGFSFTHALSDRVSFAMVPSFTFFSDGKMVAVPAGFQHDADLTPRLSFYARVAAGPAFVIRVDSETVGLAMFDMGFRYSIQDSFFVSVEPLSAVFFLAGDLTLIFKPAVGVGLSF